MNYYPHKTIICCFSIWRARPPSVTALSAIFGQILAGMDAVFGRHGLTSSPTTASKNEFDEVINSLRNDGQKPPFASRDNLAAFCAVTPGKELTTRGSGYMIQTLDFFYYIRCLPRPGDYDIYVFAFDNRYLLPELAGKHDLPDVCYSVLPSTGELISISRYEKGYSRCDGSKPNPEENRFFADTSNKIFGITRAQEAAMLAGSMFGWDVPAAKPWKYDKDGKPRPLSPKKDGPER